MLISWVLLTEAGAIAQVNATDFAAIRTRNQDSVVFVHSTQTRKDGTGVPNESYGTGFIISTQGNAAYVLTASHVVQKKSADTIVITEGSIRSRFNQMYPMEFIKRDEELDTALLILPETGVAWKPVTFGDSGLIPNDAPLYALGFPGQRDLTPANGILSNRFGPHGTWQTTLQINRGQSGGPVFDLTGKVVAISDAGDDEYQAITYVIPAAYAAGLRQLAANLAPNVLKELPTAVPSVESTFTFYKAVDHEEQQDAQEEFCLPDGYTVSHDIQSRITTSN